jgi:hypothetical protein
MLLAPAALAAGLFALPAEAHGGVVVGVGVPPVVIDTGAVEITIGAPPPPPPQRQVVVVHEPAPPPRVVYVEPAPPPRSTVVVYPRERERVVYVDNHAGRCDHRGYGRDVQVIHTGHHGDRHDHGKHKGWDKGRGHGKHDGKHGGKHRGYDR